MEAIWCQRTSLWLCVHKTLVCLLLLYDIATVFQLYHGGDMMFEMRRRKTEPILLPTQGIFNLPPYRVAWGKAHSLDTFGAIIFNKALQKLFRSNKLHIMYIYPHDFKQFAVKKYKRIKVLVNTINI